MIDFHCHLDLYPDPVQVAEDCRCRGLYVLSVTTTPSAWEGTRGLARDGDRIRTALGLHPQIAHERKSELALFDELIPTIRYIGEIGLDGAPEFRHHWDAQIAVFEHILKRCREVGGRIMSLHSRRASQAVLDRLEAFEGAGIPVLHWFSGSSHDLDRAIALGCWFSVGPAMLRGKRGRDLVARMPSNRILTESDGPFAQIDGRPIMPWQVNDALVGLGKLWSISPQEAEQRILHNFQNLVRNV